MSNEDLVRAFFRSIEANDFERVDQLLADDARIVGPAATPLDKRQFLEAQGALQRALPDWNFNLGPLTRRGDDIEATIHVTGTHTGVLNLPSMGIRDYAPTGRCVDNPVEHPVFSFRDGRISSMTFDRTPDGGMLGVLEKIGAKVTTPA